MTAPIQHHDWLSLIEISGPFLAMSSFHHSG
jgi:hypothetical protein